MGKIAHWVFFFLESEHRNNGKWAHKGHAYEKGSRGQERETRELVIQFPFYEQNHAPTSDENWFEDIQYNQSREKIGYTHRDIAKPIPL